MTNEIVKPAASSKTEAQAVVSSEKPNPIIKENAAALVQSAIEEKAAIVVSENASSLVPQDTAFKTISKENKMILESESANVRYSRNKRVFQAVGVQRNEQEAQFVTKSTQAKTAAKKQAPLYVINGKAVSDGETSAEMETISKDEIDTFEVFTEPLYVINGEQYSEEELFGEKPTSPYAPFEQATNF